ncbi:MAG: arginase family protein [Nanoarchaeota archaeon]
MVNVICAPGRNDPNVRPIADLLVVRGVNESRFLVEPTFIDWGPRALSRTPTQTPSLAISADASWSAQILRRIAQTAPGAGIMIFDADVDGPLRLLEPLVTEGVVDADRVIIVGCRGMSAQSSTYITAHPIRVFSSKEISFDGIAAVSDAIMSVSRMWPALHISFSLRALDPAFAPGVRQPLPGGLTTREATYFAQRLRNLRNVAVTEISGLESGRDRESTTAAAAAWILGEIAR